LGGVRINGEILSNLLDPFALYKFLLTMSCENVHNNNMRERTCARAMVGLFPLGHELMCVLAPIKLAIKTSGSTVGQEIHVKGQGASYFQFDERFLFVSISTTNSTQ